MNRDHEGNGKWNPVSKYVFVGFLLIAGYFLVTEHRAHVFQYAPFLLLLACPLLHLFHGHGGHGRHGGDAGKDGKPELESGYQSPEPPQHHHH